MRHDAPPADTMTLASSRLAILSHDPLNAETRLDAHADLLTPNAAFYKRNHFAIPALSTAEWQLAVAGLVARPIALTYEHLCTLPTRTLAATLECAGNGRAGLHPPVQGEPWGYGAVSTAEWTGVSLATVLEAAGVNPEAREIVFTGADRGIEPTSGAETNYIRSLPLAQALDPDTLLVHTMNGEPLPPAHGFPLRLIVAGWYGMAAVKWLTRIEAASEAYRGFYQKDRYVLAPSEERAEPAPLTTTAIRSLITEPTSGATLPVGPHTVRGFAWSGAAPIERVEVRLNGGSTWEPAELTSPPSRYAWRSWEYRLRAETPGPLTLESRTFDAAGNTQPTEPAWNALGYANNAIHAISLTIKA